MTLEQLSHKEIELYHIVATLQGTMEEKTTQSEKLGIFEEYRMIYQRYVDLHKKELEALKRGLFLSWYAAVEPSCFTGIRDLDPLAEEQIMRTLDRRLNQNISDYELDWMLSYYSVWDFAFERFQNFQGLQAKLRAVSTPLPERIDKEQMGKRGQMGIYWNSLKVFD